MTHEAKAADILREATERLDVRVALGAGRRTPSHLRRPAAIARYYPERNPA